jgi:hypothetical protein
MKRLALLAVVMFACSDSGNSKQDAPKTIDSPAIHDAHADAPPPDAPLDGPPGTQQLTVMNTLDWCSVTIGSGSASTAAQQQVFVQPGQIALSAAPASSAFELDAHMWHHTDGDTAGTGEAGTLNGSASDAIVTVGSTAKCVWVCCPFTTGMGCNITDPCP